MCQGLRRRALVALVALGAMAALAPAAQGAITPSVTPSANGPLTAGATGDLGLDLRFSPSGGDSPKDLTLNLPPGLLANASVAGGGCLTTVDLDDSTCQVGSGDVTAAVYGTIPITTPVGFYLVPAPSPGDLAGLAVASGGDQIGQTADIKVRPSDDPSGVGITIQFLLPNTLSGVPISISDVNGTFTGMRFPTTCPSTPANVTIAADSYADPTSKTASAPAPVTGCGALPYSPKFGLTVTKDRADKQLSISTQITQTAAEAPSQSVSLAFPYAVMQPALGGLKGLCQQGVASGKCKPVGTVTAGSPLYPKQLTGQAYLTGSLEGLSITLVFPPPFPLTLVGKVDLRKNITTFTGLPDIPLTNLQVSLNGGAMGLFSTNCATPSGTSTATLVDQNGDKTAKLPAKFTVGGCAAKNPPGGGSHGKKVGKPRVTGARFSGLRADRPSLRFTAVHGRNAPKLRAVTVTLPKGLTFTRHRVKVKARGKHDTRTVLKVAGVSLKGARLKSAKLSRRRLVITPRSAVKRLAVTVKPAAMKESSALHRRARANTRAKRLKSLRLTVIARDAKGKRTTLHATVRKLGL